MGFDWKTFFEESLGQNLKPLWVSNELVYDVMFQKPCMLGVGLDCMLLFYPCGTIRLVLPCSYFDTFVKLTEKDIERFLKLDIDIKGEVMANPHNYYQNKNIDVKQEDNMFKVKLDPTVNPLEELQIPKRESVTPKDSYSVCGFDANYLQPIFSSGAKTDNIKPAYNLIPLSTLKREAKAWKKGADHYGENNWQKAKGDDKFIKERINHLIEHVFLWLSGDRNEDHLANVRCNAGIVMELTEDASKEK